MIMGPHVPLVPAVMFKMFLQLPTVSMFVTILISNRYKFDSRCNIHVLSIQVFSYVVLRCTTMQNKYEDKNVKIWINFNFVVVIPGKYSSAARCKIVRVYEIEFVCPLKCLLFHAVFKPVFIICRFTLKYSHLYFELF